MFTLCRQSCRARGTRQSSAGADGEEKRDPPDAHALREMRLASPLYSYSILRVLFGSVGPILRHGMRTLNCLKPGVAVYKDWLHG